MTLKFLPITKEGECTIQNLTLNAAVSRCMKVGNGYIPLNDGEDIIFANTFVDDESDKAELLQLMLRKESFYNEKFPAISSAIKYFKDTEGGRDEMCKSVEIYAQKVSAKNLPFSPKFLTHFGKNGIPTFHFVHWGWQTWQRPSPLLPHSFPMPTTWTECAAS